MILLRAYKRLVKRFPVGVDSIQTGLLMGTGDLLAQKAVEKRKLGDIDFSRTKNFFYIGAVCVGPPLRYWYGMLHKYFGSEGKFTAIKKVIADQLLFAPIFLGGILTVIGFTQGFSSKDAKEKVKENYTDILKSNYKIWPLVQTLNFYLVPLRFQVLVVQGVALFWNTYISWKTNRVGRKENASEETTKKTEETKKSSD